MRFNTIDTQYDWQMGQAIKQLLKDFDKQIDDFTPEELADFIHKNKQHFGEIILNNMIEWQLEEDWHNLVKEIEK